MPHFLYFYPVIAFLVSFLNYPNVFLRSILSPFPAIKSPGSIRLPGVSLDFKDMSTISDGVCHLTTRPRLDTASGSSASDNNT